LLNSHGYQLEKRIWGLYNGSLLCRDGILDESTDSRYRQALWGGTALGIAVFWLVFAVALWPRDRDTEAKLAQFKIDFESHELWLKAADLHRRGDVASAVPLYEQALEIKSDDEIPYLLLGLAKYDLEDYAGAIEIYDRAFALDQHPEWAATARAVARYQQGDIQGAYADLDLAEKLNKKYEWTYENRALMDLSEGKAEEATTALERLTKKFPWYSHPFDSLGVLAYEDGERDEALAYFTEAIEANPYYANAYKNRATIRMEIGDTDGASLDMRIYGDLTKLDVD
jgi:tetratricopeptide (TPR) repeat protein